MCCGSVVLLACTTVHTGLVQAFEYIDTYRQCMCTTVHEMTVYYHCFVSLLVHTESKCICYPAVFGFEWMDSSGHWPGDQFIISLTLLCYACSNMPHSWRISVFCSFVATVIQSRLFSTNRYTSVLVAMCSVSCAGFMLGVYPETWLAFSHASLCALPWSKIFVGSLGVADLSVYVQVSMLLSLGWIASEVCTQLLQLALAMYPKPVHFFCIHDNP